MDDLNTLHALLQLRLLSGLLEGLSQTSPVQNDIIFLSKIYKTRIYKVADKLAKSKIANLAGIEFGEASGQDPDIPMQDKWNFQLGDRVRIKFPLEKFKYIQKNTIGWNRRLEGVHGECGYVISFHSQYDNTVKLYFPEIFTCAELYAGLLAKDDSHVIEASAWKVGDYVKTDEDKSVVKVLQQKLPDLPDELIGKTGKVVAIAPKVIFVTFDGLHSHSLNSAVLRPVQNASPISVTTQSHYRGFRIGERVSVISNLKSLITNQKNKGEWSPEMISILGKVVIITDLNADGTIDVRYKSGKSWRLNDQSVFRLHEDPVNEFIRDLTLKPNDKVKFVEIDDIEDVLRSLGIFPEFTGVLGQVAIVDSVTDDLEAVLRYRHDIRVSINMSLLRKATSEEAADYEKKQESLNSLTKGQNVVIDVGPREFVRKTLRESGARRDVVTALTRHVVIEGFLGNNLAVVKAVNGCFYKINKKYLTPSEQSGCSIQ